MDEYTEISVKDYAALKHISEYHVRVLIKRGLLQATRYGRLYRINIAAVPTVKEERFPRVYKSEKEFCDMLDKLVTC